MQRNKQLLFLLVLSCCLGLFLINRDLFQFNFVYPYSREFISSVDNKGYHSILESLTLKPGTYHIQYNGSSTRNNNGYCIRDLNGTVIAEGLFEDESFAHNIDISIIDSAKQIQFGVIYDGNGSTLQIESIQIRCDHVLYKDSLIRHLVISGFFVFLTGLLALRFCFPDFWNRIVPQSILGKNEPVFLFLIGISLAACYPLMISNGYIRADDMQFHLSRIEGIAESWKAGIIPARIHLFVLQNYGYGNGFFYPQLWLIFPVVLRLLGFSSLAAYNIFVGLCTILSVFSVYFCTVHISKTRNSGLVSAILYCFAPYRLIDIYYRGALGEIQSFIFIPLIVTALYDLFVQKKDRWKLLSLGFFGLLGSHIISLAIVCVMTFVFVVGCLIFSNQRWKLLAVFIRAAVLTLLLGAFFLIPMAEQRKKTDLVINILLSGASGSVSESRVLSWRYLFTYFLPWKYKNPWIGLYFWGVFILAVILFRSKKTAVRTAHVLTLLSVVSLWISTDLFPWETFSWFFNRIQFTWRFLLIPTVLLPVAGGIYIHALIPKSYWKISIICTLICVVLFSEPIYYESITKRLIITPQYILQNNRIGGGEYRPRRLNAEYVDKNRDNVLYEDQPFDPIHHDRKGLSFSFSYDLPDISESEVFEIPLAFYEGYQARLKKENGMVSGLEVFEGSHGLVSVSNISEPKGTVEVYYKKTELQLISEVISAVTLCALAASSIRKKQPDFLKSR